MAENRKIRSASKFLILIMLVLPTPSVDGAVPVGAAIKGGISFVSKGVSKGASKAKVTDFGTVAVSLLKTLFFDINNDEVPEYAQEMFDALTENQNQILDDIRLLGQKIDLSIIQNAVAEASKVIKGCINSYKLLLSNPSSQIYKQQVQECAKSYNDVHLVGNILTGGQVSFLVTPLLNQLEDIYGYCNGEIFSIVYEYFFDLYLEGIAILIASNQDLGTNETNLYITEFKATLAKAGDVIREKDKECAASSCMAVTEYISTIGSWSKDLISTHNKLSTAFRWYRFYILELKPGTKFGLKEPLSEIRRIEYTTATETTIFFYVTFIDSKTYSILENEDLAVILEQITAREDENEYCDIVNLEFNSANVMQKVGYRFTLKSLSSNNDEISLLSAPCFGLNRKEGGSVEQCTHDTSGSNNVYGNAYFKVGILFCLTMLLLVLMH